MRELHINGPEAKPGTNLVLFAEAFNKFLQRGGTVYRTYHTIDSKSHTIATTSKEIQLFLGAISYTGQDALFRVLLETYLESDEPFLLIGLRGKQERKALLVTPARERGMPVFTLSYAN